MEESNLKYSTFNIRVFGFFVLITFLQVQPGLTQTQRSFSDLFLREYDQRILPICRESDTVNVSIDVALRNIISLLERDQLLKLKLWVRMSWQDCALVWNETAEGISQMLVSPSEVWNPDITLFEDASDDAVDMPGEETHGIQVFPSGTLFHKFPTVVLIRCNIDVRHYPFDTQTCTLKFGSWIFDGVTVVLQAKESTADLTSLLPNTEWEATSMDSVTEINTYACCKYPFSEVTYTLKLRRKPKSFILSLFIPFTLILFLASLGFLLPAESGEKVSLEVTILLSLVVFLLIVLESLPSSSETYPYLGYYFLVCLVFCAISCVLTSIILIIYHQEEMNRLPPKFLQLIFRPKKTKSLLTRNKMLNGVVRPVRLAPNMNDAEDKTNDKHVANGSADANERYLYYVNQEWKDLARAMDTSFFYASFIAYSISTLIFVFMLAF